MNYETRIIARRLREMLRENRLSKIDMLLFINEIERGDLLLPSRNEACLLKEASK